MVPIFSQPSVTFFPGVRYCLYLSPMGIGFLENDMTSIIAVVQVSAVLTAAALAFCVIAAIWTPHQRKYFVRPSGKLAA